MKKNDVVVGGIYTAKVSGGVAPVKITEERWVGDAQKGWKGVNTETGRAVTIKSAQRLRRPVGAKLVESKNGGDVAPKAGKAAVGAPAAGRSSTATVAKHGAKEAKLAKDAKGAKPPKAKKEGISGLDAAAKILVEAKKPLNCKEIVAEAFKKKLWHSEGATPEATIYAAIIREIAAKGGEARFVKKDRGLFAAAKGA